ncbi:5-formyltetrahydrofolate cyclo-ligase [Lentibacillus sp. N15]|uniref:5-formyltetrahydrofolate cyclo-ligase n=1 Tax=Lentibacillus songyuanensis TaxID=3136161 RepID=UPI0031BB0EF1
MEKSQLRQSMIASLQQLPEDKKQNIERALVAQLITLNCWQQAGMIGITISQGLEWNTKPIIESAWREGKTVCVPKCLPKDKQMTFYQLDTYDQLEKVYYNLLEPKSDETKSVTKAKIDLLIVPGLLFDKHGFRIGFGGGYYDRFLQDFSNQTISLASSQQLIDHLPTEIFDIPVDLILTEHGLVKEGIS